MDDTKLSNAQKYVKDVLNFMASQGFQIFNIMELWEMKKFLDKLIRIGVAHLTSMSANNVTLGASLSPVRGLYTIFVIQAFEFDFIFKNIEFSSLLIFFWTL